MRETTHYIDGKKIGTGTNSIPIVNPSNGEQVATLPVADLSIVNKAVASSEEAFLNWSRLEPSRRASVIRTYYDLVIKYTDDICSLITEEHGKTLMDSRGELVRGLENIEYAQGIVEHLKGEHTKELSRDLDSWSESSPLGVCVGITPFNFPAMVPLWMFPLSIACGNCFILKPSEKVASASLFLAELFIESGLPPGVLNLVQGDSSTAELLMNHAKVKALSFVGSTSVARSVYRTAGDSGKRVQALGGAKNHAVVLPDADLEYVANSIMGAAFGSCGQRCMALSVVLSVTDEVGDRLAQLMAKKIKELRIGSGDENLDMGPLNSRLQKDRILALLESGVNEGANLLVDGREHPTCKSPGYYLGGCLFDQVRSEMSIYQEEIFGPVLCLMRAESFSEALEVVNGNPYGNGATIFTRDGYAARKFANGVQAGMVGINVPLPVPGANHSFGGWKDSRFGDLGAYGPDGVRFYTRRKTISQRWTLPDNESPMNFSFPGSLSD